MAVKEALRMEDLTGLGKVAVAKFNGDQREMAT